MPLPESSQPAVSSRGEKFTPRRQSTVMLSRVASCLYWMSRYLERAENIARLLDVNLNLLVEFGDLDAEALTEHWLPIVRAAGDESLFHQLYAAADNQSVTDFLTFRADNPSSIWSCISAARENARQVRDQISLEMWEVLNEAYLLLKTKQTRDIWAEGATIFYDQIKRLSHLFRGLTDSTFARLGGYRFLQFGAFLERADKTSRILDVKYHILLPRATDVGGAVDTAQWAAVLRSASAVEAYRRFYVAEILPWKVAQFLILIDHFPRSVRYCFEQVDFYLRRIADLPPDTYLEPSEKNFAAFLKTLQTITIEEVLDRGIHEFLKEAQGVLQEIAEHVYKTYMYHPPIDMAAEIRLHQQEHQQQQSLVRFA